MEPVCENGDESGLRVESIPYEAEVLAAPSFRASPSCFPVFQIFKSVGMSALSGGAAVLFMNLEIRKTGREGGETGAPSPGRTSVLSMNLEISRPPGAAPRMIKKKTGEIGVYEHVYE